MLINPYSYPSLIIQDIIISSDATNLNIRTLLDNTGWDGNKAMQATITINSGIKVGSTSTSTPAIVTGNLTNAEVTLIVSSGAYVIGKGGQGGTGGSASGSFDGEYMVDSWSQPGSAGSAGGPAIQATSPLIINNLGTIGAGGGGGGGGGGLSMGASGGTVFAGGGGGGGAGYIASSGGAGGIAYGSGLNFYGSGNLGSAGTTTSGGSGGTGGSNIPWGNGGTGGTGGSLGSSGASGANAYSGGPMGAAPGGGGGGSSYYLIGSSNVTWINTGTRLGSVS